MVATREGEEIWQNTSRGDVYVRVSAKKPGRPAGVKNVRVRGQGQLRINTTDRELFSEAVRNPKRNVFLNGTLKRLDEPTEAKPADPDHQADQALVDEELQALFERHGRAWQSDVRKLDERNCRRLKAMVEDPESQASQAQRSFLLKHLQDTYGNTHVPTHSKELQEEAGDGGVDLI